MVEKWFEDNLGDLVEMRRGVSYKGSDLAESEENGSHMINMKSFTKEGDYRPEGIKFHNGKFRPKDLINSEEIILANTDLTKEGDILGAAVMIPKHLHGKPVVGSHHTTILTITKPNLIIPAFLKLVMNSPKVRLEIKRYRRGATVKGITTNDLRKIIISYPPIAEQEKIVRIMEKSSELLSFSDDSKNLADQLARSVFLEMFGDVRLNDFNHSTLMIGDFCKVVNGSTPKSTEESYWNGAIPWVSPVTLSSLQSPWIFEPTKYITEDGLNSCSTTMVKKGSVLFSSRAPIGLVAIASMPLCTNQGFKTLTEFDSHATPEYLYQVMIEMGEVISSQGRGATFKEISTRVISETEIPLPTLNEQIIFSKIFKYIYDQVTNIKQNVQKTTDLYNSLIQNLTEIEVI